MKWPKDRQKAFLWAAKAFGTPYNRRTKKQKDLTSRGFCLAIRRLTRSISILHWMLDFADEAGITTTFWCPVRGERGWTPACDKERSLFCYLMAALTDKEFKELQG